MKIREIKLINYRKYSNSTFVFDDNINIICGDNATGKSTILEAIHYLIMLRSCKTNDDYEMISDRSSELIIKGVFFDKKSEKKPNVLISKYFKKLSLDGSLVKRASDYVGFADVVSFGTEDVYAISGTPANRRKMIDVFCSQYSLTYMKMLRDYKSILKERNALLKKANFLDKKTALLLDVIDEKIFVLAQLVTRTRKDIITKINFSLENIYSYLSGEREKCRIKYSPAMDELSVDNPFIKVRDKDFLYKTTSIGPHRDDYLFIHNNNELSKFGSQGQKKTAMLSFKMACVRLLEEKSNRKPIVLLDDVFGELDINRQNKILELVKSDVQIFITTPSLTDLDYNLLETAHVIYLEKEET